MSNPTYFVQDCPTCGRRLHIRVEYLGKKVVCQHCRGKLEARDPAADGRSVSSSQKLLQRADELLDAAASREPARSHHPR